MNLADALTLLRVRRASLTRVSSSPAAPPRCHQLKKDTEFREFLSVHQKRTQAATWANDALDTEPSKGKSEPASDCLNFDSDSGQESEEEGAGEGPEGKAVAVRPARLGACASMGLQQPGAPRWGPSS